jgi:hypothetical protein
VSEALLVTPEENFNVLGIVHAPKLDMPCRMTSNRLTCLRDRPYFNLSQVVQN